MNEDDRHNACDKWDPLWAQALEMAAELKDTSQCTYCKHDYADHAINTTSTSASMDCTKCDCHMSSGRGKGERR